VMNKNILLGQYCHADSWIHERNAAGKILSSLLYMVALFIADDWLGWGILAAVCVIAVLGSRIPLRSLWKTTRFILTFAAITCVLNIFLYPGEELWRWGLLHITREGIYYGIAYGIRLLLLVEFASLLTLTTKPIRLTDGLEKLMAPLKVVKVPVHEIAMMMTIALRFIPTLLEEFQRITLAQRSRGADLGGKGNLLKKVSAMIPLLIPLFISAFRRAEDLAQAMEAKCYRGGDRRTHWKRDPWKWQDTLLLLLFVLLTAALIWWRVM